MCACVHIFLSKDFGYWTDCIVTPHTLSSSYYTSSTEGFFLAPVSHSYLQIQQELYCLSSWIDIYGSVLHLKDLECLYQVNPRELRFEGTSDDHIFQHRCSEYSQLQQVAEHCLLSCH